MTLRIKLKHLAVVLGLLVLMLFAWFYEYPNYLYNSAEKLKSNGDPSAAVQRYEKLFTYFASHPKSAEALYWAASMAGNSYQDNVQFLFPSQKIASGVQEHPVSVKQGIAWVEQLQRQYPNDQITRDHADWLLATLYDADGQLEKAKDLYQKVAVQNNSHNVEAKQALQYMNGNQLPGKSPQITGTFRINGVPQAGKHVFLIQRNQRSFESDARSYPHAVTDAAGKYAFSGLASGEYEVGIRVHPDEIKGSYWPLNNDYVTVAASGAAAVYDINLLPQMTVIEPVAGTEITGDSITFRWHPQAGAAYYRLTVSSFGKDPATGKYLQSSAGSSKKIAGTEATYTVEEVSGFSSGAAYEGEPDAMKVVPLSVIGTVYPGGLFGWSVTAYDHSDRVINSSAGYFTSPEQHNIPLFSIGSAGELEGDKYLLAGDYDKAISAYKKETGNPRALRILARLEGYGAVKKQGEPNKLFANPAAAISYLEKLPRLLQSDAEFLAQAYEAAGQTDKAQKLREQYPDPDSSPR